MIQYLISPQTHSSSLLHLSLHHHHPPSCTATKQGCFFSPSSFPPHLISNPSGSLIYFTFTIGIESDPPWQPLSSLAWFIEAAFLFSSSIFMSSCTCHNLLTTLCGGKTLINVPGEASGSKPRLPFLTHINTCPLMVPLPQPSCCSSNTLSSHVPCSLSRTLHRLE